MRRAFLIFILLIAAVALFMYFSAKGAQNRMVELNEGVKSQWAQVENVYQRRADLIPNLVETVKGATEAEQAILDEVTEARSRVSNFTVTPEVLENPELMQKFTEVQGELSGALTRLMAVTENYPDLKSISGFNDLQRQLEGTENRISVERKKFNDVSRAYNTYIKKFPTSIWAGIFGYGARTYFEAEKGAENAPEVNFSN